MHARNTPVAAVALMAGWLSAIGASTASGQVISSGCTAPDLDDAIRRVDALAARPSDAELAALATALLDGIDTLDRRQGACSDRLAAAHVYLALMHAWLPDSDPMGLTEEKARRLKSIAVSAQFEHALHLHATAARSAMARVRQALTRAGSPVLDLITVEFENAETAVMAVEMAERAARWAEEQAVLTQHASRPPDRPDPGYHTAVSGEIPSRPFALGVGGYYGHPTGANTRGATFGPYVFAGLRLPRGRLSVGIAAGAATHGGFAPAAAAGLRHEFARRAAVFLGFGTRLRAGDSVPSRSGIVIGIDWSVFGREWSPRAP